VTRPRLAFVSTMAGWPWGGSEELWSRAASGALDADHPVGTWTYRWPAQPPPLAALASRGAHTATWRHLTSIVRVEDRARRVLPVFGSLRRFRPDAVCVSQGHAYEIAEREPLFRELHALATRCPTVIACQYHHPYRVPAPEVRDRMTALVGAAAGVACVAQRNLDDLTRELGVTLANGTVVQNPVNLADRSPVPWPPAPAEAQGPARLACVARYEVANKAQDALFEALRAPAWRDRAWNLDLFGSGPDRDHLERLVRHYGMADRVRFRGHVDDVRGIWREHELLVLPSRAEGTPLAMVEAMLCGRPCLVTDVGGATEWVTDGETGFVAPSPNTGHLAAALDRAWDARNRWPAMGSEAARQAAARFDPDAPARLLEMLVDAAS